MALPASGIIALRDVNVELSKAATAIITLNDAAVRDLAEKVSGTISMSDLHGKSSIITRTVTASVNNLVLEDLYSAAEWSSSTPKEIIIDSGVIVGSTSVSVAALRTGAGAGGTVQLVNNGSIRGAGGVPNSGAGGHAIEAQIALIIANNGDIRGGGGAGGAGGKGANSSYRNVVNNGWREAYNEWWWSARNPDVFRIYWNGATIVSTTYSAVGAISSYTTGGYTYTRYSGNSDGTRFAISRYNTITTSGGAGGQGGRGQGSDGNAVGGSPGSAGGTNAGTGGTGGTGGGWGAAGSTGAAGAGSDVGAGASGTAGGAAGRAVSYLTGGSVSWLVTGTRSGAF